MASLIMQHNRYYAQFYDELKYPSRKRVALKTSDRATAEKLLKIKEAELLLGKWNPWEVESTRKDDHKRQSITKSIEQYCSYKSNTDWRSSTAESSQYVLKRFSRHVGENRLIQSLSHQDISSFLNRDGIAYETRRSYRTVLFPYARWLSDEHSFHIDLRRVKIRNRDTEQREGIHYLSTEQIERLKAGIREKVASDIEKGYQTKERNALWLIDLIDWLRYSGMRISEALALTPNDIDTDTWEVSIGSATFTTKVKAKQILPIAYVEPLKEIAQGLIDSCESENETLFKHSDRRRTLNTYKKYLKLYVPEKSHTGLHSLRHSCCIELLRRGVSIYVVQRWLRHSNVQTTQKYADMIGSDVGKMIGDVFLNSAQSIYTSE